MTTLRTIAERVRCDAVARMTGLAERTVAMMAQRGEIPGAAKLGAGPLVFWHSRGGTGQPFRNAPTYLAKLVRAAGQRFRVHDLRHRFAIEYLRAGGDIYRLSRILGHSSVKTTEIYLGHVGTKTGTARDPWDAIAK